MVVLKKSFLPKCTIKDKGINLKVQTNQIFGHMDNKWKVHHGDKKKRQKTAFYKNDHDM